MLNLLTFFKYTLYYLLHIGGQYANILVVTLEAFLTVAERVLRKKVKGRPRNA